MNVWRVIARRNHGMLIHATTLHHYSIMMYDVQGMLLYIHCISGIECVCQKNVRLRVLPHAQSFYAH